MNQPEREDAMRDLNARIGNSGQDDRAARLQSVDLAVQLAAGRRQGSDISVADTLLLARRIAHFVIEGDTPFLRKPEEADAAAMQETDQ